MEVGEGTNTRACSRRAHPRALPPIVKSVRALAFRSAREPDRGRRGWPRDGKGKEQELPRPCAPCSGSSHLSLAFFT
eukprot:scaffold233150_cov24-Tisochrysis_lutea.AAC.1